LGELKNGELGAARGCAPQRQAYMMMSRVRRSLLFPMLASLVVAACDPGLTLEPVGWTPTGNLQWEAESDGVHFVVSSLGGLVGSEYESFELTVQNRTSAQFVVDEALLETNGKIYKAETPREITEKWPSVSPGATEQISLLWSLDGPLDEVFDETAALRVAFHLDGTEHDIRIDFRRRD
jgi:hypothetical protein